MSDVELTEEDRKKFIKLCEENLSLDYTTDHQGNSVTVHLVLIDNGNWNPIGSAYINIPDNQ